MKAAFFDSPGGPEVIRFGDLPRPEPKINEVLVRVGAAALNPIDIYIRSGAVVMNLPKPFIPGCDLAGRVEAVGPGVHRFRPGERVWGSNQGLLGRQGTYAEYVCTAADWLHPTPDNMTDQEAAGAALVGITAHLGLFRCARLQSSEIVFVNGGTGGVGSMVLQMAKAVGASVIATVGSEEKAEECRQLGADFVINYKKDDVPSAIRNFTKSQGVNVWYETQRDPDFMRTVDLMAFRGRLVIIAGRQAKPIFPVGQFYVKNLSLFGFAMFNSSPEEQRQCTEDINRWFSEGKLRVRIGKTFPLSEAAAAHRLLEENTMNKAGTLSGKIVLFP